MTTLVFMAVICAALLHAGWNAVVKGGNDKLVSMTAVVMGHGPFGLAAVLFSPLPDVACLPYVVAGVGLHVGYQVLLLSSYRVGDLTQVYPIARGVAPLVVVAVSVLLLGVPLGLMEQLAVVVIAAGIMSLSLVRHGDGMRNGRATALALATGCFIAGYSLIDGTGARVAGTALGYYGWLTMGNVVVFGALVSWRRPGVLRTVVTRSGRLMVLGGGASYIAYSLVIWAFTQAPIALVTALRETSIVFALLIGVFFLKEPLNLTKVISTLVTLAGAALMRLARH